MTSSPSFVRLAVVAITSVLFSQASVADEPTISPDESSVVPQKVEAPGHRLPSDWMNLRTPKWEPPVNGWIPMRGVFTHEPNATSLRGSGVRCGWGFTLVPSFLALGSKSQDAFTMKFPLLRTKACGALRLTTAGEAVGEGIGAELTFPIPKFPNPFGD